MRIGIDCRIYGPKHTGIGRYVQNLVEQLLTIDNINEYTLFSRGDGTEEIQKSKVKSQNHNSKFKIVETDIPHYSLKEQILLPQIISKEKVDLMHFPHFNVPVLYQGKYIVTIHDLIKHTSKGTETTTRSPLLYWLKYLGYKFVFNQAVKRAEKIITPSQFVKDEVVRKYGVGSEEVVVTYEGVDHKFKVLTAVGGIPSEGGKSPKFKVDTVLEKYKVEKPFLLYVGSVYPHKNIERLIEAVKILNQSLTTNHQSLITLVIVCARNVFIDRVNKYIAQMNAQDYVSLAGFVPDEDLAILYQEAEAFVFPTLSEGFGLPGLEAMSVGCPVICSDIPVLREVYKNSAVYFDPFETKDIAENIKNFLSDKKLLEKLKNLGPEHVEGYSWEKMAKETLEVYKTV